MPLVTGTALENAPDLSDGGEAVSPLLAPWATTGFSSPTFDVSIGRYPHAWHKFYVPQAGACVVSDYPPGMGSQYNAYTPSAGDTYLQVYRGPASVGADGVGLTSVGSDDDGAGGSKGKVSWNDPGDSWIYVAHGAYGAGNQFSGQYTYVSYPCLVTDVIPGGIAGASVVPSPLVISMIGVTEYTAGDGVSIPVPAVMDVELFSGFAFGGGGSAPPTEGQLWPRGNPG